MTREELYARDRRLVDDELPRAARGGRWVVTADHCSGRILLDSAVGGCWYDVLDRRRSPAAAQLDDEQLAAAVALAERLKDLPAPLDGPSCPPPLASSRRDPAGGPIEARVGILQGGRPGRRAR